MSWHLVLICDNVSEIWLEKCCILSEVNIICIAQFLSKCVYHLLSNQNQQTSHSNFIQQRQTIPQKPWLFWRSMWKVWNVWTGQNTVEGGDWPGPHEKLKLWNEISYWNYEFLANLLPRIHIQDSKTTSKLDVTQQRRWSPSLYLWTAEASWPYLDHHQLFMDPHANPWYFGTMFEVEQGSGFSATLPLNHWMIPKNVLFRHTRPKHSILYLKRLFKLSYIFSIFLFGQISKILF